MRFAISLLSGMLAVGSLLAVPAAPAQALRPDLAQPQHPRRRPLPARRHCRYRRAPRQPEALRGARPAGGDREPRRRQRHARRGRRDQVGAGRLHDPDDHRRLHHRALADAGDHLRPVQGPDPGHPLRQLAAAAAHASGQRAQLGEGPDRQGQGRTRQARLRFAGRRHHQPARGRMARRWRPASSCCTCPIAAAPRWRTVSPPATPRSA